MRVNRFFDKHQKKNILKAITEAEKQTSGEIRVHLESRCPGDSIERAKQIFVKLQMHETKLRNGVLIYVAVSDRKLAIFGDQGINEAVPGDYWEAVKDEILSFFREGSFADGIITGISRIGEKLKDSFPYQGDDVNELSNDLSIND